MRRARIEQLGARHLRRALGERRVRSHQSRHYSLYLALQIKARMEGIDTPVYGLQEVHHVT